MYKRDHGVTGEEKTRDAGCESSLVCFGVFWSFGAKWLISLNEYYSFYR